MSMYDNSLKGVIQQHMMWCKKDNKEWDEDAMMDAIRDYWEMWGEWDEEDEEYLLSIGVDIGEWG